MSSTTAQPETLTRLRANAARAGVRLIDVSPIDPTCNLRGYRSSIVLHGITLLPGR